MRACFAYIVFLFVFCLTLRTVYEGHFYDRYSYVVVLGSFFAPISKCFEKAYQEKKKKKKLSWVADFNAITVTGTQKNKDLGLVC